MNQRWSLEGIYTSFESEEFKRDMKGLDEAIIEIKHWGKNQGNREKLEGYLKHYLTATNYEYKIFCYAMLSSSVDSKNEKAFKVQDEIDEKMTEITAAEVEFKKWVASLKELEELINSSSLLKEHEFYLKRIKEENKYLLSEKEEVLISKMQNSGGRSWEKLHDNLIANLMVDITLKGEKKQLPLQVVRNMAYEKDMSLRKAAYEAELEAYKKIEESSAACLNAIKGEALTITEMRGYKSPLERTLINFRMNEETLNAMLGAIKEALPQLREFLIKKGELLGYKKGLPFYELNAPAGDSSSKYSYEDARELIVKNFSSFSSKLAHFADRAFENRWIDSEPREGKEGGAFCCRIHSVKESRILSSFSGNFSGVNTLAHELGHGYHNECLKEESILNCEPPLPIAETASTFCETIVNNGMLKSASKDEAVTILDRTVNSEVQVIVDIYCRYLFETEVFNRRKQGSLSVKEINELMVKCQKEAYGEGLDENYLHPYMWVCKPHYYFVDAHFYNFPYAFGQLFAKGLYAEYLKRGEEFVKDYDKLLSVTGKKNIEDIAKIMNIDIESADFWRGSLEIIIKGIERFIEIA